jgi:hypothetical protein
MFTTLNLMCVRMEVSPLARRCWCDEAAARKMEVAPPMPAIRGTAGPREGGAGDL